MTTWREALTSTWAEAQMRVQAQSRAMPNVFNVGILSNAEFGRECKFFKTIPGNTGTGNDAANIVIDRTIACDQYGIACFVKISSNSAAVGYRVSVQTDRRLCP